jgi:hypothetical protein
MWTVMYKILHILLPHYFLILLAMSRHFKMFLNQGHVSITHNFTHAFHYQKSTVIHSTFKVACVKRVGQYLPYI